MHPGYVLNPPLVVATYYNRPKAPIGPLASGKTYFFTPSDPTNPDSVCTAVIADSRDLAQLTAIREGYWIVGAHIATDGGLTRGGPAPATDPAAVPAVIVAPPQPKPPETRPVVPATPAGERDENGALLNPKAPGSTSLNMPVDDDDGDDGDGDGSDDRDRKPASVIGTVDTEEARAALIAEYGDLTVNALRERINEIDEHWKCTALILNEGHKPDPRSKFMEVLDYRKKRLDTPTDAG